MNNNILGHGNYKYKVHKEWASHNASTTPIRNCHEMVMDLSGQLIMITDHTHNNILIFDKSGKIINTWGTTFPGGHGLTLFQEGEEEFLFITDVTLGKVFKTTLDGKILLTINHPSNYDIYSEQDPFKPTETAIATNGDIYVADGYGSQYIIQYNYKGEYVRHIGGEGDGLSQFKTVHGLCIDNRNSNKPTLLCTSRDHNAFKRFSMEGEYISTIHLPGAYVCRPVIDEGNIYSGVCWSRLKNFKKSENSGFVTILDDNDKVVSNPGGTMPNYINGELQLMVQDQPVFDHCHDVCVDDEKNLYVCQWSAGDTFPYKLERV